MEKETTELKYQMVLSIDGEEKKVLYLALRDFVERQEKIITRIFENETIDDIAKSKIIKYYEDDISVANKIIEKLYKEV